MSVSFFDSNVPIYLLAAEGTKALRSEQLLLAGGIVSVQVLNEIAVVARRKFELEWAQVHAFLGDIRKLVDVVPLTVDMHDLCLRLAERHKFHVYDAMIIAAALEVGCDTLYTEDMHPGPLVEGQLTLVDPFT